MAIYSDIAICLRRIDFSEHSQILTLLTGQHGTVRLIAKGLKRSTRKRTTVGVDLLELGRVIWSAGPTSGQERLCVLREWQQQEIFLNVRQELAAIVAAEYAAEALSALLPEMDPYPELFDVLCKFLAHIGPGKGNLAALVRLMWLALYHTGHLPQWQQCGVCGRTSAKVTFFSPSAGGAVCRGCAPHVKDCMRLDSTLGIALKIGRPQRAAQAAFPLLDSYIASVIGRALRSRLAVQWAMLKAAQPANLGRQAAPSRSPADAS